MNSLYRTLRGLALLFLLSAPVHAEPPIRLGVQLALTGDLASAGTDMLRAIELSSEKVGKGRYELLVQDDACDNRQALSVAHRFITLDRVKAVLGFTCNQTLLATAPVYERAKVVTISSSGTSGDIKSLGPYNVRIFPSDRLVAEHLFKFVSARHRSIALLTEQTDYATMMERSFLAANARLDAPRNVVQESFRHDEGDIRTVLLRLRSSSAEALYINADSDTSFITVVKQLHAMGFESPRYAAYFCASATALSQVQREMEGMVCSNLAPTDTLLSATGQAIFKEFTARYGPPTSGFPVVPFTLEAFRLLDSVLRGGGDVSNRLRGRPVTDGWLSPYAIDAHGNAQGFPLRIERVRSGKVEMVSDGLP